MTSHTPSTEERTYSDDELYELLKPFGNAGEYMDGKRYDLFDVVRKLLATTAKASEEAVMEKVRAVDIADLLLNHFLKAKGENLGQYRSVHKCACGADIYVDGHDPERANLHVVHAKHIEADLRKALNTDQEGEDAENN